MRVSALVLALLASACATGTAGIASDVRSAVDAVASVIDPLYEAAAVACDTTERLVVARPSDEERDARDLLAIREACDRSFLAFDAVRRSHISAVALIRVAEASSSSPDLASALEAVEALRAATEVARSTWRDTLLALKGKRR